jgi:hypothetical protein
MRNHLFRRFTLVILVVAVAAGCWFHPVDRLAHSHVTADLQRALTAFAAARLLGGALSVIQGTQVDVTPGGVGLTVAPGKVLQPLNELVDRFAAAMLAASVAFGIQLVLLNIGTHAYVSVAVSVAVLGLLILGWRAGPDQQTRTQGLLRWLQPVAIALLLIRFAVPLSGLANEALYRNFMADDYMVAVASIQSSPQTIAGRTAEVQPKDEGFIERMKRWSTLLPALKASYERIVESASDWVSKIIRLIALFAIQTVIMPIAFSWLAWRIARAFVLGPPIGRSTSQMHPSAIGIAAAR